MARSSTRKNQRENNSKSDLIDSFMSGIPNVGFGKRMREILGGLSASSIREMLAEAQGKGPDAKKKIVLGPSPLDKKVTKPTSANRSGAKTGKSQTKAKPSVRSGVKTSTSVNTTKTKPSVRSGIKTSTSVTPTKTTKRFSTSPAKKAAKGPVGTKEPIGKANVEPRTIAQAKRMGKDYFVNKKGKKLAAVTKEELKKSGLTLREYLNKKRKSKK